MRWRSRQVTAESFSLAVVVAWKWKQQPRSHTTHVFCFVSIGSPLVAEITNCAFNCRCMCTPSSGWTVGVRQESHLIHLWAWCDNFLEPRLVAWECYGDDKLPGSHRSLPRAVWHLNTLNHLLFFFSFWFLYKFITRYDVVTSELFSIAWDRVLLAVPLCSQSLC